MAGWGREVLTLLQKPQVKKDNVLKGAQKTVGGLLVFRLQKICVYLFKKVSQDNRSGIKHYTDPKYFNRNINSISMEATTSIDNEVVAEEAKRSTLYFF